LLELGRDDSVRDMQLGTIMRETRDYRAMFWIHRLVVAGFLISINVKLCIQWQVGIRVVIILMPLHVFKDGADFHFLKGGDNLISHVPIGLKGGIRKRVRVGKALFDPSKEAEVVGHKLDTPRRMDTTIFV
jgi:hypothetical protein